MNAAASSSSLSLSTSERPADENSTSSRGAAPCVVLERSGLGALVLGAVEDLTSASMELSEATNSARVFAGSGRTKADEVKVNAIVFPGRYDSDAKPRGGWPVLGYKLRV
eukprot:CAMPEP_0178428066 /NCGR_PEP_ID=MMETSP0689_2-20121128/30078_1 /TAXON_ID=160604 /ORGANISM="Amphidinium massartii, Strain CS-259" /LENGTH=109 /DNA_ID=CAMNT_0020049811 /DNA_START=262 /DNA_END=591 /DNA_ORIENTATION=+